MDERMLSSLRSGQCFRFKETAGVYEGVIGDTLYSLSKNNLDLLCTNSVLHSYFDLDRDYESITTYLSHLHPIMKKAIDEYPYIRILKQNREEVLLSFILSSCNNISRISLIIERLSKAFGEPITKTVGFDSSGTKTDVNNFEVYTFPSVSSVVKTTEETLRSLGLGFRAPFFLNAARAIDSGTFDLDKINTMSNEEARRYLTTLQGIGPKVADCILLFGFARLSCFPKDVHIKHIMNTYFSDKTEDFFHPYEGIAEQFLFCLDLYKKDVL